MKSSILDSVKIIGACALVGGFLAQPANAALCKLSPTGMADYTQYPLFENANVPPVSLLLLSIDHQLFNKAYTDYTNLDSDPEIEVTFDIDVNYSGYFGSNICYDYAGGRFEASALAVNKKCSNKWSGNFLNWLSMTRLDVLRWTLYGGNRSIDTLTETELERAHIPQDGHSYVKVFSDTPGGTKVSEVTPFTGTTSFCNTTSTGDLSQTTNSPPVIQVAPGAWRQWATIERYQCDFRDTRPDRPFTPKALNSSVYNVKVKVCGTPKEDFCSEYGSISKPTGLLQQYGQGANPIEFGLMSGSYDKPRSGGVLRSKIGKISQEINQTTGIFYNQENDKEGIINSIRRIRMAEYARDDWDDCSTFNIPNGLLNDTRNSKRKCSMWGNPISELYAEAIRYFEANPNGANAAAIAAGGIPTGAFNANDGVAGTSLASGAKSYITGMPKVSVWGDPLKDRLPCTKCSIIVLSTGLNSFDRDQIPQTRVIGSTAGALAAAVDQVGVNEGVTSGSSVLTGSVIAGALDVTSFGSVILPDPPGPKDTESGPTAASFRDCSAKTTTGMSQLSGICPEVGSLQGGYDVAGLAFKAYTKDVRPDLPNGASNTPQTITTYTVALGESLPRLDFELPGGKISVLPFGQSGRPEPAAAVRRYLASSIVNFTPGFQTGPKANGNTDADFCRDTPDTNKCKYYGVTTGNTANSGSYVINWEDSTWGNDYDQDGVQVLSYCIGGAPGGCTVEFCDDTGTASNDASIPAANRACGTNPITFTAGKLYLRSQLLATTSFLAMRFGWITGGSDAPGIAPVFTKVGDCDFINNAPGDFRCGNQWDLPQVRAYSADGTGAKLLENPLFYAAKYGSFVDAAPLNGLPNNGPLPANNSEWDKLDLSGNTNPDGIPDNYFPVRNPSELKKQLGRALARIASASSSGSSAAVVSSTGEGSGAVFQATYSEKRGNASDVRGEVKWAGSIRGLWITPSGEFAEDSIQDGKYTPFVLPSSGDNVVTFKPSVDPLNKRTIFTRNGGTAEFELDQLLPIWDAAKQMTKLTDLASNRAYESDLADTKRYITTWIDANRDKKVDSTEQVAFEASGPATNVAIDVPATFAFTNTCNVGDSKRLINWVRGIDQPGTAAIAGNPTATPPVAPVPAVEGLRSRQYDLDNNNTLDTNRLGDIVNSSPLVVAKPNAAIDFLYRDTTYTTFANKYRCRRSVVYAGANDGMLHAFNGGFRTLDGFSKSPPTGCRPLPVTDPAPLAHELGTEIWGYVPGNLLAHLPWMADPNYTHVFYVDGSPQSFDVKAFPVSPDNPGGWGTILVVPFRLGGGPISVPTTSSTVPAEKSSDFSAPAFIVFDVTNPEVKPKLLAEVVLPNDGSFANPKGTLDLTTYSLGAPTLVFDVGAGNVFDYRLIFGSGPTEISPEVHSTKKAKVFSYSLSTIIAGGSTTIAPASFEISDLNSFTNDMNSADFDFGGTTDSAYFGTNAGLPSTTTPLTINQGMTGKVYKMPLELVGPVGLSTLAQPGRSFDIRPPSVFFDPQAPVQGKPGLTLTSRRLPGVLFGTGRMLSRGDFVSTQPNANALYILDDVNSFKPDIFSGTIKTNANEFRTLSGKLGFKRTLDARERGFTAPLVIKGIGVFTSFKPSGEICEAIGTSRLFQFNFANETSVALFNANGEIVDSLGEGAASNPRAFVSPPAPPRFDPVTGALLPATPPGVRIITQIAGSLLGNNSVLNDFDSFGEQAWWEPREAN